ncbi:hypothetical protein K5549_020686, partial [Capra hircus]|uniref:Uncharacterized protein n=1 Tax=Capra hircus TaxID=9925 RepID=A0A452G474_CAPHI
ATLHLFMLEVKCFTFHWRRQKQVMKIYLALFRGEFIFINIFVAFQAFLSMELFQQE